MLYQNIVLQNNKSYWIYKVAPIFFMVHLSEYVKQENERAVSTSVVKELFFSGLQAKLRNKCNILNKE